MSDTRAVLVTREQRSALARAGSNGSWGAWSAGQAIAAGFDAADNQPRVRWCVEHGAEMCLPGWGAEMKPCRVVDAIVVPLPDGDA